MSETSRDEQIVLTILQQLGGSARLAAMIGATGFYRDGSALGFRFKGSAEFNAVKITLDPSDTYTVRLMKIAPGSRPLAADKTFDGIYEDALVELLERETGLRLSL
jgi:hypothetical protein